MKKVLLISTPFGALERQALGLSLFKAHLEDQDIACDVRYLTFTFADLIGVDDYEWIVHDLPHTAFGGEWTFRSSVYGDDPALDTRYQDEILRDTWQLDEWQIARLARIRDLAPTFLDYCMAAVAWREYALVGFTSTFEQNLPSLALARRVKSAYPDLPTVFGGGNWEGEMGLELHRRFPWVDYVCPGEADGSFPRLVKALLRSPRSIRSLGRIGGLIYRSRGLSRYTGASQLVTRMDALPVPDYSDYFRHFGTSSAGSQVLPTLLFEGSRGCWWGAREHCTFCGLNGATLRFRSKSGERVVREVGHLVDKWGIDTIQAVDNVIDMRYFNSALPALARQERSVSFFYEVRANMKREHVRQLAAAGVRSIQAGIESLNDHVLALMHKGTTALQNIQLLKWCREYDISVSWNLLFGFPGETQEDYQETLELLKAIRFLQPPTACGPVRLDRFSPFFVDPAAFGIVNVRPMPVYRFIYPFPEESIRRIAYYFDYDYAPEVDPRGYADDVQRFVAEWSMDPERGHLQSLTRADGSLVLLDTRRGASNGQVVLSGLDRLVYEYCSSARSLDTIQGHVARARPGSGLSRVQIQAFLEWMTARRLMVTSGRKYLSLALGAASADASERLVATACRQVESTSIEKARAQ
jgi:ribosomal peptide maturation radical SAM protein 1